MAKAKSARPSCPGQRLAQDAEVPHIDARLCVSRINRCQAQPARLAQRMHEHLAGLVDIGMIDIGEFGSRPLIGAISQRPVGIVEKTAIGENCDQPSVALEHGFFAWRRRPRRRGGNLASACQIAWACASASIACSIPMFHSCASMVLVIMLANVGPSAMRRAKLARLVLDLGSGDHAIVEPPALAFLRAHRAPGVEQVRGPPLPWPIKSVAGWRRRPCRIRQVRRG